MYKSCSYIWYKGYIYLVEQSSISFFVCEVSIWIAVTDMVDISRVGVEHAGTSPDLCAVVAQRRFIAVKSVNRKIGSHTNRRVVHWHTSVTAS